MPSRHHEAVFRVTHAAHDSQRWVREGRCAVRGRAAEAGRRRRHVDDARQHPLHAPGHAARWHVLVASNQSDRRAHSRGLCRRARRGAFGPKRAQRHRAHTSSVVAEVQQALSVQGLLRHDTGAERTQKGSKVADHVHLLSQHRTRTGHQLPSVARAGRPQIPGLGIVSVTQEPRPADAAHIARRVERGPIR